MIMKIIYSCCIRKLACVQRQGRFGQCRSFGEENFPPLPPNTHMHTHAHTCTHMHTHTHAHTCTHVYTYAFLLLSTSFLTTSRRPRQRLPGLGWAGVCELPPGAQPGRKGQHTSSARRPGWLISPASGLPGPNPFLLFLGSLCLSPRPGQSLRRPP